MQREEIERLKRIDLIAFLESMGFRPSWRSGEKAMFFSPLREENNPSFYVQRSDGYWTWKDWGTGESGDIINFVELYYGINFTEAVRRLDSLQTATGRGVLPSKDLGTSHNAFEYGLRKETVNGVLSYSASINRVREFYRKGALMNFHKMDVVKGYFLGSSGYLMGNRIKL